MAIAQLCTPPLLEFASNTALARPTDDRIFIYADAFSADQNDTLALQGNVQVLRKNDSLFSERVLLNKQRLVMDESFLYISDDNKIQASSATIDQQSEQADFTDAELFDAQSNATFNAARIAQLNADEKQLTQIRYTRCEANKRYWELRAASIRLNNQTGRGLAKHAHLRLFGVPFFYLPIFSFPIDDRRASGFLYPAFARSSARGDEINIPYYWNIRPQSDATFNLRNMSKRGQQLNTEWRHLSSNSKTVLYTENLYDEIVAQHRHLYYLNHDGRYGAWQSRVSAYALADPEHIDDLATESGSDYLGDYIADDTYLRNRVDVSRRGNQWQFDGKIQTYEFADSSANEADAPYQLYPQLAFRRTLNMANTATQFRSEWTQFAHNTKTDAGIRWVNTLDISKNYSQASGYIKPQLTLHATHYDLDNKLSTTRNIPITSMDAGLFFDRYTATTQQTLEPRLFLLYVPFEAQNDLPDFDTDNIDENVNTLFARNRFTGSDRIGDAELATVGLTSRLYNRQSKRETLRLQLGQRFYFADQQVSLDETALDTRRKSAIFTRMNWQIRNHWSLRHDAQLANSENETAETRFSLQYRRSNDQLFYISHNRDNIDLDQVDINGRYRLGAQWVILGKYQYDFENKQNIQKFAGVEYENCCLALRVVAQTLLENDQQQNNLALQLSLKGLSTLGDTDSSITNGINGFNDNF